MKNNSTLNVLLPIGAFRCIRHLQEMSHNQFLLLVADKAHSHEDDLKLTKENPHLVTHGSFSFMSNFHAIREYILNNNGKTKSCNFKSMSLIIRELGMTITEFFDSPIFNFDNLEID